MPRGVGGLLTRVEKSIASLAMRQNTFAGPLGLDNGVLLEELRRILAEVDYAAQAGLNAIAIAMKETGGEISSRRCVVKRRCAV
ncbi:MAG TPA: hypothetical protein VNK48_02085 [Xanthobacteraceae bacterium]|nr:hypothetical protein [Xanthobacteraceae bacterium]